MTRRKGGRAWQADVAKFLATTTQTECSYCGHHVDRSLPGRHPWGPSVDHVVPLMLGGPELVRNGAVLRLMHNRCNAAQSNRLRARHRAVSPTSRDW